MALGTAMQCPEMPPSPWRCHPLHRIVSLSPTATLSLALPLPPHHFHPLPNISILSPALPPSPQQSADTLSLALSPSPQHSHSLPSIPILSPVLPPSPQYSHLLCSAATLSLASSPPPTFPPSPWFPVCSQAQTPLGKVYLHLGIPKDWTGYTGSRFTG